MKFLSTKEGQKHAFTFAPMYKKRLCDRLLAPTPRFLLCITMYLIKYLSSPDLNLFWVLLIDKEHGSLLKVSIFCNKITH